MLHVAPGIIVVTLVIFVLIRYTYRKKLRRNPKAALLKEIAIWRRTAEMLKVHDGDEEKLVHDKLLDYIKQLVCLSLPHSPSPPPHSLVFRRFSFFRFF